MLNFIVNPNAGGERGYRIWKRLERRLNKLHITYRVYVTGSRGEAAQIASGLSAENTPEPCVIVAVGGDGIMNEVLDGVHLSDRLVLGYIPTGWRSDLARGLRLPKTPGGCLARILSPREIRTLDYAVVNYGSGEPKHRRFLVSCGAGYDAQVTESFRRHSLRHFTGTAPLGAAVSLYISIRSLLKSHTARGYVILDDSRRVELNHIFLLAGLMQPTEGAGLRLGTAKKGTDGGLSICIVHTKSKFQQLKIMFAALRKNPSGYAGVRTYSCRQARVVLEQPLLLHTDGETCGEHTEYEMHCVSGKLQFIC